jgi:hypothetical protein
VNTLLQLAATVTPFLPGLLAVVTGLLAIFAIVRGPVSARGDRAAGIGLAVLVAIAVGAVVGSYTYALSGFDSGPQSWAVGPAIAVGTVAAGLTFLSGLAGYATLALARRSSRFALVGSLAGPFLFIGLSVGGITVGANLQNAAYSNRQDEAAAALATRSQGMTLTAADVAASFATDGTTIGVVHLNATIRSDRALALQTGLKTDNPRFQFLVANASPIELTADEAGPGSLVAGGATTWGLTYRVSPEITGSYGGTYQAPGAGEWALSVDLVDVAGVEYHLETSVPVVPDH